MNGCRYEHIDRKCHNSKLRQEPGGDWCVEGPCPHAEPDDWDSLENQLAAAYGIIESLKVENGQLRAVVTQMDPEFFKRKCRVCGCDWNHPCNDHDSWVGEDLCSECFKKAFKKKYGGKNRDANDY